MVHYAFFKMLVCSKCRKNLTLSETLVGKTVSFTMYIIKKKECRTNRRSKLIANTFLESFARKKNSPYCISVNTLLRHPVHAALNPSTSLETYYTEKKEIVKSYLVIYSL